MATQSTPLTDAAWTPKEALLTDEIANEVYASQYAERKMSRFVIGTLSVLLLGSLGAIVSLAHKPIQNRYIRIDEIGRAQAIQYSDLNYSPREGEVRTYLTDWANYRYTVSRDTISKKYPLNYFFFSQQLSTQFMSEDNRNHMISQVMAGQMEQSDVEVRNVTITSMAEEQVQGVRMSRGTALVNIDKLFSVRNSHEPRTEHWMLSVTYYLNPKQVSEQSRVFPQFETINPLGMTITEFHENRIGVDPISDGTAKPRPAASTLTPSTISAPILPGTESGAIR
ncbi:VirB8/TrbF family protein (plasmid) [Tunturiibacter empetritectus]|jgi:type IV secretion system protein VirB5|uniref:VirB8/TrbF family protein n=1 Tax=Tunturiibacter empetritectus TaxID=3069691 RepID=UPI003D9BE23B